MRHSNTMNSSRRRRGEEFFLIKESFYRLRSLGDLACGWRRSEAAEQHKFHKWRVLINSLSNVGWSNCFSGKWSENHTCGYKVIRNDRARLCVHDRNDSFILRLISFPRWENKKKGVKNRRKLQLTIFCVINFPLP